MTSKYPYVVTVYRMATSTRPVIQNYNFEDVGIAHAEMYRLAGYPDVVRVALAVILKEVAAVRPSNRSMHAFR